MAAIFEKLFENFHLQFRVYVYTIFVNFSDFHDFYEFAETFVKISENSFFQKLPPFLKIMKIL